MSTKLTLRLDESLIHRAKHYAAGQNRSLSQLVADYFAHLAETPSATGKGSRHTAQPTLGPITTALHGAFGAPPAKVAKNAPSGRNAYRAYLEQKHK